MEEVAKETEENSETIAETIGENSFLKQILNQEEYELLPVVIIDKIESSIQQSFDEFLTNKALYETSKSRHEEEINKFKEVNAEREKTLEDLNVKLSLANSDIKELQSCLKDVQENCEKLQEKNKELQSEWQNFKIQRDQAIDEKESLLRMVERRNSELTSLKIDLNDVMKQLEAAVKAKMVAMENSEEVESLKVSLSYKEKRLEQESKLIKNQLESVTEELNKQTTELAKLKRENSTKFVSLEAEVAEKTQELKIAQETIADLRDANDKLTQKAESLLEKLVEVRHSTDTMYDNFQQELQAQTKLSQLYKDLCEENDAKTEKLTNAINELQQLLKNASNQYGELETKQKVLQLEHEEETAQKNECIRLLKKELENANELLKLAKEENLETAIAAVSPCAAAASRLIKSGMSLTQIYTQYATVSEQLLLEKEENRKLTLYVNTILNEIEEKAPILKQQRIDYENALNNVESLTKQMDDLVAETKILQEECADAKKSSGYLRRENERLKKEVADLSRQVCYLIKSVEEARGGFVSEFDGSQISYDGNESSAQHIISKKLVTFSSIQDLQENNQKLLALVRQLSAKQEEAEKISSSEFYDLKVKEEKLQSRVNELMEDMEQQSKMLDLIKNQSLTYKKLYDQAISGEVSQVVKPLGSPAKIQGAVTSTPKKMACDEDSNELNELKKKLDESEEEKNNMKKELDKCKDELNKLDKHLTEQIQSLKKEANDLIYKNSKLVAQAEFYEEKCKVMVTNIKTCKTQIQALEERNQMLSEISAKHEQSTVHLRHEVMQLQSNLSKAEVTLENLRQENFLLKTAEARLLKENECYNRERHSHSLLMSNLDSIKATFERSEEEGKLRLETQLSEALKECSALKNAMKEEKSRFKELAASLERQTAVAKERMQEEKSLADKAREDLETVRQELETKNKKIEELLLKIRELNNLPTKSLIENVSLNLDESIKRNKELESKIRDLEHNISCLELQLTAAKQHRTQYCEMAESLEKQLNEANENHENFRGLMIAKVEESTRKENEWKEKYAKLEEKYQNISNTQKNSAEELNAKLATSSTELKSTNTELINLRNELSSTEIELKKAKDNINSLSKSLQEAEAKYSNEVVLHSTDIQALSFVKKELNETIEQISKLKTERDNAVEALKLKSSTWEEKEKKATEELKQLNQRLTELDEQNRVLHENIQELGNTVAVLQCRVSDDGHKPIEECSSFNESTELSSKAQDQLLKVIKFLRQEKDVSVTKSEVLQAENVRLKTQLAIITKQLEETKDTLKNCQESSDVSTKASIKHAELLRRVDTLNAITDSNRILREERDKLQTEVTTLKEKLEKAESKLLPLMTEIKKLSDRVEEQTTENQALMIDLAKWKQKAERSTRGTPEDWRRLTNERENLAKQWQLEKNNNEKLEDELKKVKQEKTALNEQMVQVQKTLQNETNEIKRLTEECNSFKQQFIKTSEALNTVKNQLNKTIEESAKLTKDMEAKEDVIKDLKTKEEKLRRLCNKYRTQYEVLLQTTEDEKKAKEEEIKKMKEEATSNVVEDEEKEKLREEGRAEARNEFNARLNETEAKLGEKIKELEGNVSLAQAESESLRKDNENLKTSINEKEERVKTVMKNARTKIAQLMEQKKNFEMELEQIKGQTEMSRDESDSKMNTLKAHYESKISEMEKERTLQSAERDQERDMLNNQIKVLNQKINQMQRLFEKQLGAKPSTSSRVSDKSSMEPPTANIKPMAGSSSSPRKEKQTTGPVGPCWRSGNETPFASIRPTISMQARTLAVLPTSQTSNNQTPSSQSTPVMVLPQQQVVHTTGNSGEAMSSSPTSSHTDYMPATSSATPTRQVVVAPPLSVGPHIGSDAQSTQEMEAEANENEIQQQASQPPLGQQQLQTVAMVMPRERVEQPTMTTATTQGGQQQSVDQSYAIAYSQANSSNTVTTTQAGLKRTRDVEGDSSTSMEGEDIAKIVPQNKRVRVSVTGNQAEVFHHQVTHSEGIEVEYQVPTSSQRDQEDDNLIMIDSDDEGNADEGDVEGAEDEHEFEEDNGGYAVGSYSRDGQEIELPNYDEGPDIDEENVPDQDNNEVEVVDDGNEVPNQSGAASRSEVLGDGNATQSSNNASVPVASSIESANQDQPLQQSSEATSSGPINNESESSIMVVSQAAASSLSSQAFRSRNVPLLSRQQQSQLILPQNYEESGDDGIVPSTPTLFVPRRTDGFGEAVSSPQIPHQARFTFSDPSAPITRSGLLPATGEGSEDSMHLEEPGTGRSVPTTPLQVSPQDMPIGETVHSEVGQSSSSAAHIEGDESDVALNIPDIVVTISEDDDHCETPPPELSESTGEEEEEPTEKEDTSGDEPEVINLEEENDGVTSEGEKPLSALGEIEEGREAEPSEPFDSAVAKKQPSRMGGNVRRSMRVFPRRGQPRRPTPIVWNEPGSSSGSSPAIGSAIPTVLRGTIPPDRILNPDQPRTAFRGRMQRARKWR